MGRPMKRQPNVKRERPAAAIEKRRAKTAKRKAKR